MKYLIVVRHGRYGYSRGLDDVGRAQMGTLAQTLKPRLDGGSIVILSSPALRAKESAKILGDWFGIDIQEHGILWSDNDHHEDLPAVLELVRSQMDQTDVLILVTHLEYTDDFMPYFTQHESDTVLSNRPINKGEACILDCREKTLTYVP